VAGRCGARGPQDEAVTGGPIRVGDVILSAWPSHRSLRVVHYPPDRTTAIVGTSRASPWPAKKKPPPTLLPQRESEGFDCSRTANLIPDGTGTFFALARSHKQFDRSRRAVFTTPSSSGVLGLGPGCRCRFAYGRGPCRSSPGLPAHLYVRRRRGPVRSHEVLRVCQ